MNTKGMGHTRLGRFAAVTVPAAVVSAGMGYAMLSGMVGAVISSSGGFNLQTDLTASDVRMRAGATEVGSAGNNQQTVYAETVGSRANTLAVATPSVEVLPGLAVHLSIGSTDPAINLGDVALNAATLNTPSGATLNGVSMGVAQSEAGFTAAGQTPATGYVADAFALTATGGGQTLNDLDAQAYAVTLSSLTLSNLSLGVVRD